MTSAKKQHYVPQFYLKGFSNDGVHLSFEDKVSGIVKPVNIRDIAQENRFYNLEISEDNLTKKGRETLALEKDYVFIENKKRIFSLERWFHPNEEAAAHVLINLKSKVKFQNLDYNDKVVLTDFIIMLMLRGKQGEQKFNKIAKENKKNNDTCMGMLKHHLKKEQYQKLEWLVAIVGVYEQYQQKYRNFLLSRKWIFHSMAQGDKLNTSDNPVILCNLNELESGIFENKTKGILSASYVVIPLSKYCCLQITNEIASRPEEIIYNVCTQKLMQNINSLIKQNAVQRFFVTKTK